MACPVRRARGSRAWRSACTPASSSEGEEKALVTDLVGLLAKWAERTQITNIRNERGELAMDSTELRRSLSKYY